jgi:hypothetical protein
VGHHLERRRQEARPAVQDPRRPARPRPAALLAGGVIGQLVGSGKLPLSIIDMADFEAGGLQRFFVDFAPALMRMPAASSTW